MSSVESLARVNKKLKPNKKAERVEYDSDIDPDDLLPVYLESKSKLFHLQSANTEMDPKRRNDRNTAPMSGNKLAAQEPEFSRLLRKIKKIEDDVLFDKYLANYQWESLRIQLEKEAAVQRHARRLSLDDRTSEESDHPVDSDDEVSREAAKMGEALLAETGSDDDTAVADLFASLPISEVDPVTGKSNTIVNGANGVKVIIRDFGKWTGVNPTRVLEEACRARLAPYNTR